MQPLTHENGPFTHQFNHPVVKLLVSPQRSYRVARHLLLNVLLVFIFFFQYLDGHPVDDASAALLRFVLNFLVYGLSLGLIYGNIYYLVPRMLFKGNLTRYLLFTGAFAVFYTCAILFGLQLVVRLILPNPLPPEPFRFGNFVDTLILPSIFLASTTGIQVLKKWISDTIRMVELEKQNLQEELKQLKSQVNPHFLFNTLNNLHVLTRIDPEKASQVLLSLSDILRYQLYESNKDKVLLTRDIANIRQILMLEKLRRDHFEYTVEIEGQVIGKNVPPFLFTPFVENAVKYSTSAHEKAMIDLKFVIEGDWLHFQCWNTRPILIEKRDVGGLGLYNIRRRLELLFPNQHEIDILETEETYTIKMTIPI